MILNTNQYQHLFPIHTKPSMIAIDNGNTSQELSLIPDLSYSFNISSKPNATIIHAGGNVFGNPAMVAPDVQGLGVNTITQTQNNPYGAPNCMNGKCNCGK